MFQKSFFIVFFLFTFTYGFACGKDTILFKDFDIMGEEIKTYPFIIETKIGYFFFSNSKMRKVFNQGGIDVQINSFYPINKCLQVYGSIEYLEKHGKSLGSHQKTNIWQVPLSLGLKCIILTCGPIQGYFSLGARYFFVHVHNNSKFVDRNMRKSGLGGVGNIGLHYFPCNNLFIDLFGEYSYGRLHFHSSKKNSYGQTMQIGGFTLGVGLGYLF